MKNILVNLWIAVLFFSVERASASDLPSFFEEDKFMQSDMLVSAPNRKEVNMDPQEVHSRSRDIAINDSHIYQANMSADHELS